MVFYVDVTLVLNISLVERFLRIVHIFARECNFPYGDGGISKDALAIEDIKGNQSAQEAGSGDALKTSHRTRTILAPKLPIENGMMDSR